MKRIILLVFVLLSFTAQSQSFYTSGNCKAGFKFEVNYDIKTFAPATVLNFYDTSSGNVKQWYWDFGNNEYSNEQNPVHIFNHPIGGPNVKINPYRTITLTIVTDTCKSTYSQTINIIDLSPVVQQNCAAHFKYFESARDSVSGIAVVNFVNGSLGNKLQYLWQFGDGTTSTEKEPVKKFSLKQFEYKVCLTITSADSCVNTFCDVVYLQKSIVEPPKCFVDFGYNKIADSISATQRYILSFYYKSYPEAKEWYWDFGDGTTSNEPNPVHEYKSPLNANLIDAVPFRKVCLTVLTVDGCKVQICHEVNVSDNYQNPEPACKAHFKYEVTKLDSVNKVAVLKFYNGSSGNDLKYLWQFGNGLTSNEKEPEVKISLAQSEYKVCLTVTGANNCTNSYCIPVYPVPHVITDPVLPACVADFGYNLKDILMSPLPSMVAEFYSKVYPQAKEYYWEFGDGATSSEANPTHIYIKKNDSLSVLNPYREVCLTVVTSDGCKVRTCKKVPVFGQIVPPAPEKCNAIFKYIFPTDLVSIPEVVMVKLMDVTEGEVAKRLWQFENGKTSTEKEPLVSFNIFQPVHKVCLTVTMKDGCESTWCSEVYVKNPVIGPLPPVAACPYKIKIAGGFPIQMSSCAGWASATVYNSDGKEVTPKIFSWSTGDTLANVKGLCPTKIYAVKALMPEGCVVYAHFVLNADGSIAETSPANWSVTGSRDNLYIKTDNSKNYQVEWRLCDGTIVKADSVPLNAINCGGAESNYIVKDSMGNVVYTESIALKGSTTGINDISEKTEIKMWPNPVSSKLNIGYSGKYQPEINVEICDVMGKRVSSEIFRNISNGQEFSINTESLKQGIYICRISGDGKVIKAEKFSRR